MIAPRELKPLEFTERLEPIFRSVESRLPKHLQNREFKYLGPRWRSLMDLGVARTWEIPNAVLGMLITPDLFSGIPLANVVFWFSLPGTKGTVALLRAAEQAAQSAGCARISIAAYGCLEGERIGDLYNSRGYAQTEKIFQKELT